MIKSKSEIIEDILERNYTWDIYSLSIIYLHIFGNFSRIFSLNKTIINEIIKELCINIHPNPNNRGNLDKLQETFEKFYNVDWSFVKNLPCNKMYLLFNELER